MHAAPDLTLCNERQIMGTDYERQLLARVRTETITTILGGGRRAGLDPDALGGLVGAATALGFDEFLRAPTTDHARSQTVTAARARRNA
jgi:hypothetical protein